MKHRTVWLIGLAVLIALGATCTQAQEPVRGIVHVTGDLYRAQDNNHFTAFLVTPEGIILTDPINNDFAEWLRTELDARFGVPVRYVVYSHSDFDHASGGAVFADTAEFVGHENMRDAELNENVHPPTMYYSDRHTIALGGKSVQMIHPGPAHSDNMSIIRFPEENALFVVDIISLKRVPFQALPGYDHEVLMAEMRMVEAMNAGIVIPGHGDIGTTADVRDHRHYLEEMHAAVSEGIAAGRTLAEMQESITMAAYSDWASFDEWRALNVEGMYNYLTAD